MCRAPEKLRQLEVRKARARLASMAAAAAKAEGERERHRYKTALAEGGFPMGLHTKSPPHGLRGSSSGARMKPGKRAKTPRSAGSSLGGKTFSGVDLLRHAWSGTNLQCEKNIDV